MLSGTVSFSVAAGLCSHVHGACRHSPAGFAPVRSFCEYTGYPGNLGETQTICNPTHALQQTVLVWCLPQVTSNSSWCAAAEQPWFWTSHQSSPKGRCSLAAHRGVHSDGSELLRLQPLQPLRKGLALRFNPHELDAHLLKVPTQLLYPGLEALHLRLRRNGRRRSDAETSFISAVHVCQKPPKQRLGPLESTAYGVPAWYESQTQSSQAT